MCSRTDELGGEGRVMTEAGELGRTPRSTLCGELDSARDVCAEAHK